MPHDKILFDIMLGHYNVKSLLEVNNELNKQNLVSQMTMILPILTFVKLHAKVCDVFSLKLGHRIQKTQNYTTQIKVRLESIGNKCNCDL